MMFETQNETQNQPKNDPPPPPSRPLRPHPRLQGTTWATFPMRRVSNQRKALFLSLGEMSRFFTNKTIDEMIKECFLKRNRKKYI